MLGQTLGRERELTVELWLDGVDLISGGRSSSWLVGRCAWSRRGGLQWRVGYSVGRQI